MILWSCDLIIFGFYNLQILSSHHLWILWFYDPQIFNSPFLSLSVYLSVYLAAYFPWEIILVLTFATDIHLFSTWVHVLCQRIHLLSNCRPSTITFESGLTEVFFTGNIYSATCSEIKLWHIVHWNRPPYLSHFHCL